MPAGLQVINNDGIVQIDENYYNLFLAHKGTVAVGSPYDGALATVTYTGTTPMIFFKSPSIGVAIRYVTKVGSTYTYRLVHTQDVSGFYSVDYYIFDRVITSSATYGFCVYNSGGEIVFDSSMRPLRIVGSLLLPNGDLNTYPYISNSRLNAPTGNYAACIGCHRQISEFSGGMIDGFYMDTILTDATGVSIIGAAIEGISASAPHPTQPIGGQVLLADVSGY